jgi:pterin-4a-carbinolamine dehydratase
MRYVVLAALLCSCADDRPTEAELHEKVTCAMAWTAADDCEVPCAAMVRETVESSQPDCVGSFTSTAGTAQTWACHPDFAFDYEGVRGCCARIQDDPTIYFAACE